MNQSTLTPDQARLAARYPGRSATDSAIFVIAALAMLAAIAIVVISGLSRSNPPVAGMVRAFDVIDQQRTNVEVVVQRTDPSKAATCSLYAQATNFEKVGEVELEVPPAEQILVVLKVEIRTLREATSVSLKSCALRS